MTSLLVRLSAAAALCVAMVTGAAAQESTNQVAVETDWSVFVEPPQGQAKECWGVSAPKETVNTRGGKPVSVRRGDILLFVTYRAGGGGRGEVSFTGGYPFASGSTASVDIAGQTFELFTEGEFAWTANGDQDAAILTAMRKGVTAIITARSGRGTQTKDTFSLRGFTAAMEDAAKRCN